MSCSKTNRTVSIAPTPSPFLSYLFPQPLPGLLAKKVTQPSLDLPGTPPYCFGPRSYLPSLPFYLLFRPQPLPYQAVASSI